MLRRLHDLGKRYGRKKGLLRHCWFLLQYRLRLLRRLEDVDWGQVQRLVFVCDGNICRSPYAEARARAAGLSATSFGLHATAGVAAHDTVRRLARETGLDLASHVSRAPAGVPLGPGDLVVGLEPRHAHGLAAQARDCQAQVTLLGLWAAPPRPHIEDPFGLSEDYFRTCLGLIDDAILHIARLCRQRCGPPGGQGH